MRIVVVGGGTATNSITPVLRDVAYNITYVVPVSDNGGSTSEILRVFGGPAIGDARSRLVRLIDPSPLRSLLAFRLNENKQLASSEWNAVVDGSHSIWADVPSYMKAMYRAFLVSVHAELLKRTTTMHAFNFSCASVGNLLLTGARLFFGTLEAAIEFVLHTNRVPANFSVLPCVNSSFSHHIAATLRDGSVVVGQSQISHPMPLPQEAAGYGSNITRMGSIHRRHQSTHLEDDGHLFSHPSLRIPQIQFTKHVSSPLSSSIDQVYYINPYGDEIKPKISSRLVTHLQESDAVVLSIGSLYTSIVPVVLLQGFAVNMPRKCVLIINGSADRETQGMDAIDYLDAICKALEYSLGEGEHTTLHSLVTDVVYPTDLPGIERVQELGIACEPALCIQGEYNHESLGQALKKCLAERQSIVPLKEFT